MRALTVCVLSVCVLVAGFSGCKPKMSKAEKQALQEEVLRQEVETRFAEIAELRANGQMDAAMALLEKGFSTAKYKSYRSRFFSQKVDLLLAQDKCEEAGGLILKTWGKEPPLALGVFGRVHAYYLDKQDNPAMLVWCRQLLDMGKGGTLPKGLRPQVLEWLFVAALALDDMAAVTDAADRLIAGLEPHVAAPRLQQAITSMIGSGKFSYASELITHLATHADGGVPAYRDLVVTASLKNLIAQGDWQKVPEAFEVCAAQLTDESLLVLLRQTFPGLQKSRQVALLEAVCNRLFLSVPSKKASASYAARLWVDIGVGADKRVLADRLVVLLDADVLAEEVAMLFERHFYQLVQDVDAIKRLCVICERIMGVCTDQEAVQSLKVKLMDGAFITENYDLALALLESGITDKSKAWHEMSIPKVKAHRALAQGKTLEAIGFFREFMKVLNASDMEEEHDPTTGVAYSREWILGWNAHRIAGLYASIPDAENAAKAREEAKALFDQALKKAGDDADTLKVLKEELKTMGF